MEYAAFLKPTGVYSDDGPIIKPMLQTDSPSPIIDHVANRFSYGNSSKGHGNFFKKSAAIKDGPSRNRNFGTGSLMHRESDVSYVHSSL